MMFMKFAQSHMRATAAMFAFMGLFLAVVITLAINGSALETRFFPVNSDWIVTSAIADGDDVVLTGKITVRRQCAYKPPPQGKIVGGRPLATFSASRFQNQDWLVGETYEVGPWRVEGGRGQLILLSQVHECHSWWDSVSRLGTFDARNL